MRHDDSVRNRNCLVLVACCENHYFAFFCKILESRSNLLPKRLCIFFFKSSRNIVNERNFEIAQKQPCYRQTLFVYRIEFSRLEIQRSGYADFFRRRFDSLVDFVFVRSSYFERIGKIIIAGTVCKQRQIVENHNHVVGLFGKRFTVEKHFAFRIGHTCDNLQKRGFAAQLVTEKSDNFSVVYSHIHGSENSRSVNILFAYAV